MNQRLWLIGVGAGAFLLFLIGRVPAVVAVGWLGQNEVRLTAVSGTIWSGSADSIVAGRLRLNEAEWSLSPFSLLLGRLRADVRARIGDGKADGSLSRDLSGNLSCTNCRFTGPVSALWGVFPVLKAVGGRLDLEIAGLDIRERWPARAVGTARLSSNLVPAGSDVPPAVFQVTVNADPVPEDGRIEALIEDAGGPVKLRARLDVTPPGNFGLTGQVATRPGAPADVSRAVAALGPRGPDGSTQLTLNGTF
jgi:general secretion pathway protein N